MKRLVLATGILAIGTANAVADQSKTYDLPGFDRIAVATDVELNVEVGRAQSVRAETAGDDLKGLIVEVKNNVLMIRRDTKIQEWVGAKPFKVTVTAPALKSLDASAGSRAEIKGDIKGDFALDASSSARAKVASVIGDHVVLEVSSGAQVELAGSCRQLTADVSSGAEIAAGTLKCDAVSANASSGGQLIAHAVKKIGGNASSGGSVSVLGKPSEVNKEESSGGHFRVSAVE